MSSKSLNKVQLIGNLTRDPELRYTPSGTAVVTFGMATNRSWTTETGERKEEAEFHRIVAWNKLAEIIAQLLVKGRKVFIEGRLQTRSWTGKDGVERQTTEIVASDMIILDPRGVTSEATVSREPAPKGEEVIDINAEAGEGTSPSGSPAQSQSDDSDDKKKKKKTADGSGEDDVNPDDIPF